MIESVFLVTPNKSDCNDYCSNLYELYGKLEPLCWTIPAHSSVFGYALSIPIPENYNQEDIHFRIYYSTTPQSAGLQWLTPSQTIGKKHPFVYSQGQAILARTYLPCQDTPAVKFPYSASIITPKPLVALCSGIKSSCNKIVSDDASCFCFVQTRAIPAYLISLVVGDLHGSKIGPRSHVYCESPILDAAVKEFEGDIEKFIATGEIVTVFI